MHRAAGGAEPQPSTSRRQLLGALAAAPLLLEALQLSVPAAAAAAAAGPRFLTPEEQAAVDKAFSSTVPKIKVRQGLWARPVGRRWGAGYCSPKESRATPWPAHIRAGACVSAAGVP